MIRTGWCGLLGSLLIAGTALSTPALADPVRRALLVGVSDYPKASVGDLQLTGPKNDVALMLDTLPKLGFRDPDVMVLADGLKETGAKRASDGMPTRAAILKALEKLAKDSQPDDLVLVFLSGHGSRQPDLKPEKRAVPKPDGLDEIFLPIDIGKWDDGVSSVQNAIQDVELGQAVTAIRQKGAHVWVVIDACHSGTMTRSADAVAKQVPLDRLAIPAEALARAKAAAEARAGGTRSLTASALQPRLGMTAAMNRQDAEKKEQKPKAEVKEGSYVAFFAAYPDQSALQRSLPRSYGGGGKPHGVLTYYLAQALRGGAANTYRDLAHQVLAGYEMFGAKAPTPMFEGDLQLAIPGAQAAGKMTFSARRTGETLSLAAGAVDGLAPGTLLALAGADEPGKVLGHARIERVDTARAALKMAAHGGRETALADLPDDSALLASIAEKGVELAFVVARPALSAPSSAAEKAVVEALSALEQVKGGTVEIVPADSPADLSLRLEDGRLWFVPEDGRFEKAGRGQTASLPLDGLGDAARARAVLERAFGRLAKARNLIRVAGAMPGRLVSDKLKVEGFVARAATGAAPSSARAPDDRTCGPLEKDRLPGDAIAFADLASAGVSMPDLQHCDVVYFRLTNTGANPIDVTPLYVDGGGGIAYMGPPTGLRLEPRAAPSLLPVRIVTYDRAQGAPFPIGQERLLMIAVEMTSREALPADFRYLAQPTLTAAATRNAGGAKPLRDLLENAAFAGKTRTVSAPAAGAGGVAGIADFRWQVVPPEGVK